MMLKKIVKKLYQIIPFKRKLYVFLNSFLNFPQNIYKHLHFKGEIKVEVDESRGFKMNHYGYQVENDVFWSGLYGSWERVSLKLWTLLCEKSTVIVDVGANTGIYSLLAKTVNINSIVYAFEPIERVYLKLVQNIELNDFRITPINEALSDQNGKAIVYDTNAEHTYSVAVNKNLNQSGIESIEREINIKRLDSFIKKNNIQRIDLMKIDVETHEAEVLEGMGVFLERFKPHLLIEILDDEIASNVERILNGLGYQYFEIDEQAGISAKNHINVGSSRNYLCFNNKADPDILNSFKF